MNSMRSCSSPALCSSRSSNRNSTLAATTAAATALAPAAKTRSLSRNSIHIACSRHQVSRYNCSQRSPNSTQAAPLDAKGLSYLGDSIWTLCVRRHFFTPPKHWRTYQDMVQPYVTAEGQASMYDALLAGAGGVSATEQDMLRAVRSQVVGWRLRKRFAGDGAEAYRKATAFEALIGHLHLHDPDRLMVLTEALMDTEGLLEPQNASIAQQGTTS